jgi:hypothetical protein
MSDAEDFRTVIYANPVTPSPARAMNKGNVVVTKVDLFELRSKVEALRERIIDIRLRVADVEDRVNKLLEG